MKREHEFLKTFFVSVPWNLRFLDFASILSSLLMVLPSISPAGIPRQQQDSLRTWTDVTGKFSTEAELVRVAGDIVELKKSDGNIIKIPLAKLSSTDQDFIRGQSSSPTPPQPVPPSPAKADVKSLSQVRSAEQKLLNVKTIVDAYNNFLQQPDISESERLAATRRIEELRPEAERDALMIGKRFLLMDEVLALKKESNQIIDDLVANPNGKDKQEVIKLLKAVSRKDPVSCRANYLLGMGFAMVTRDYDSAMDEFRECISRLEDFGDLSLPGHKQALSAMHNNLALIQIRRGYLVAALKSWEDALADGKTLPSFLRENLIHEVVFINGALASGGVFYFNKPEPAVVKRHIDFLEKIGVNKAEIDSHGQHGWRYLNLSLQDSDNDLQKLGISMVDEACLCCNGTGLLQCKKCGGDGIVIGKVAESKLLPTGQVQIIETSVNQECKECERGSNPCRACNDGEERLPR